MQYAPVVKLLLLKVLPAVGGLVVLVLLMAYMSGALSGVSKETIAQTLDFALDGLPATVLQVPGEVNPLWVNLEIDRSKRSSLADLDELYVRGEQGQMVQIGALGDFVAERDGQPILEDKTIYRKNLRRVVYVFADVAGRPPADAILDIQFDQVAEGDCPLRPARERLPRNRV